MRFKILEFLWQNTTVLHSMLIRPLRRSPRSFQGVYVFIVTLRFSHTLCCQLHSPCRSSGERGRQPLGKGQPSPWHRAINPWAQGEAAPAPCPHSQKSAPAASKNVPDKAGESTHHIKSLLLHLFKVVCDRTATTHRACLPHAGHGSILKEKPSCSCLNCAVS